MNLEFDHPIAERVIEAKDSKLTVKLGPPHVDEAIGGWLCPYHIEGLPGEPNYRMFGGGIDGIHAIIAALANLGAYLNSRKNELGLSFYDTDYLGFLDARQPPLSKWSEGYDE